MSVPSAAPAIVSKRNQFRPADELVEEALPDLPEQFKHPGFKSWLLRYTESVIRSVSDHFGVAAQRGIAQTAELLCDPDFYATRRERRTKERRRWQEDQAKQEWDRVERMNCPTAEQIGEQILATKRQIDYHREQLNTCENNLEKLQNMVPRTIQLVPSRKVQ
jgi:hypothetical protein